MFWLTWGRLLVRLGLRYPTAYQLRHSVATARISAGVAVGDVVKYLDTTVATVVKSDLHPSGQEPSATMNKLFAGKRKGLV